MQLLLSSTVLHISMAVHTEYPAYLTCYLNAWYVAIMIRRQAYY